MPFDFVAHSIQVKNNKSIRAKGTLQNSSLFFSFDPYHVYNVYPHKQLYNIIIIAINVV